MDPPRCWWMRRPAGTRFRSRASRRRESSNRAGVNASGGLAHRNVFGAEKQLLFGERDARGVFAAGQLSHVKQSSTGAHLATAGQAHLDHTLSTLLQRDLAHDSHAPTADVLRPDWQAKARSESNDL